nr:PREDICTED: uncharacterized protein LOC109036956 isoform X2 [Bemisia tabaci]
MRLIYITGLFAALLCNLTLVTSMNDAEIKARASLLKYHQADTCPLLRGNQAGFKATRAKTNCERALDKFLTLCIANDHYQNVCYDPTRPADCDNAGKVVPRCSFQCRKSPTGEYKAKQLKDIRIALRILS